MDTDVVAPDTYDFFLVSQISRQGVVSPTHYVIVYDNKAVMQARSNS